MSLAGACGTEKTAADKSSPTAAQQAAQVALTDGLISGLEGAPTSGSGGASSNPYDYINKPAMKALVALGTPALIQLDKRLPAAGGGVDAYLMAVAMVRISHVDFSTWYDQGWDSAQAFDRVWVDHLTNIPDRVAEIAQSDAGATQKTTRLVALGTPAIPFILDRVAQGDLTVASAAAKLMRGAVELETVGEPAEVTPEWAQANVGLFAQLRELVMAQQ